MGEKKLYTFGLFGRCISCKEISKVVCKKCGATDSFVDSGRVNHVLCTACSTQHHLICPNEDCHGASLQYRTPKNLDEQKRIEQYIEIKKDKSRDLRSFTIRENFIRDSVEVIKIAPDGSYSVPSMKNKPITGSNSFESPVVETIKTDNELPIGKERRIVNQFYDESDDEYIDKRTVFEVVYDEKVFFNCNICGRTENMVTCSRCSSDDKFNLNYEALSCQCGNVMKVVSCECGAKQNHHDLYIKSNDIKWQFSKAKSYYDYCKGRMTVFSTCPVCEIFSAEQCKSCGSKVNFGLPNSQNEVYCKNCGTINTFRCDNSRCNNIVKILRNPESSEQKFDWLHRVTNLKRNALKKIEMSQITVNDLLSNDFVERVQQKNREMISPSFINEVAKEVDRNKKVTQVIVAHNRKRLIGPTFYFIIGTLLIIILILLYEFKQVQKDDVVRSVYQEMIQK